MEDPEHVHYQQGAKKSQPRKAAELPRKRVDDAPDAQAIEGSGPAEVKRNVSPAHPRDAAVDERQE